MANEFQIMPNPDNVPGLVSSGYQRQNTLIFAARAGLDTTEPFDDGNGVITIPAGGIAELNGVLFKITSGITLNKPAAATAYWIAVTDNGNGTASAALVTRPGAWNPAKQGCYLADGRRTLNWVSLGEINNISGLVQEFGNQGVKGEWTIRLKKGWYYAVLRSGLGGGNGTAGSGRTGGGAGGVPGSTSYKSLNKIFFYDGRGDVKAQVGGSGYSGGAGGNGGVASSAAGVASGGDGGKGGGGGGGRGQETSVAFGPERLTTGWQPGGNGGAGANGGNGSIVSGSNQDGGSTGGGGAGETGGNGGAGGGGAGGGFGGNSGVKGIGRTGSGNAGNAGNAGDVGMGDDKNYYGGGGKGYGGDGGDAGYGTNNCRQGGGGGAGGGMGADGDTHPDGEGAAGYCAIYGVRD
jgi:hypothetical protein